MIFQRAIRRELLNTVGAVFTVLFTIVMTVMLIRILGDAASGKIAPKDVAAMLGFAALGYLPVIISLTAFIAVLMVVARSYQDSEMVVWLASGASLTQWIRPVLSVGMPMVLLTAALSIWPTAVCPKILNTTLSLFQRIFGVESLTFVTNQTPAMVITIPAMVRLVMGSSNRR
jgi:lipopolysaccharide export system permease protein